MASYRLPRVKFQEPYVTTRWDSEAAVPATVGPQNTAEVSDETLISRDVSCVVTVFLALLPMFEIMNSTIFPSSSHHLFCGEKVAKPLYQKI